MTNATPAAPPTDNTAPHDAARTRRRRRAAVACGALVLLFGVLAMSAAMFKSATIDEPLHAAGAFLHVFERDFRVNPEDPPLWNYLAMLPHRRDTLRIDRSLPDFEEMLRDTIYESRFSIQTLYFVEGNDGIAFIDTTRRMMALLGIALAATIAAWAWRLAGPVAAVSAAGLFCLDPNFIGHAPLIKNDVAISLAFVLVTVAMWSVGRHARWWNVPLLGLLCGAAMATKFSGVLVIPMLLLWIATRALFVPQPWPIGRRAVASRAGKLAAGAGVFAACGILAFVVIWASYGFRYAPTPDPDVRLNLAAEVRRAATSAFFVDHGRSPSETELARLRPPDIARAVEWVDANRLLPQAYLHGFLYTYHSSLMRHAFLLGEHRSTGWWYYFPLAMLFKTPLATLAAIALAAGIVLIDVFRRRGAARGPQLAGWTAGCIAVPLLVYGASAITTNLNLGLRHVLPLYPFIYLLVGVVAARVGARWGRRRFSGVATLVLLGLAVETFAAFPHFISFFNAVFSPHRLKLLSDSNLDWGQDLPALRDWQERHPGELLYLGYFGAEPPERHGIEYLNLPGGYFLRTDVNWPEQPGVIAISATLLQGTHLPPSLQYYYGQLRQLRPREILGGSIYLYDVPSPPLPRPTREAVERQQSEQRR